MENNGSIPILIPISREEFWATMRTVIRQEVIHGIKEQTNEGVSMETPGLLEKPLYKIQEVCSLFKVTKPTIYAWIKHGKLKRVKIRSRVYFLGNDVRQLMQVL